jgi:hypothetical protein
MYQGGLPVSCVWAASGVSREDIDIAVFKLGQGVYVRYGHRESCALNMMNLPEQVRAELLWDWSVLFGTSSNPIDLGLTNRMVEITRSAQDGRFWQIHLLKIPLRSGELGTPAARVCKAIGQWDDFRCVQTAPMYAKEIPTFVEATRVKETQALLRFGRDSNWPLKVTFATMASPKTSLAITYDITWDGLQNSEEENISSDWCWGKFMAKVSEEDLTAPPAFLRQGVERRATVRKENNSIRAILREQGIWTPEDPDGPPPMILFGPKAVLKVRTMLTGDEAISEMLGVLQSLCQGRYELKERVISREWALVGSFGSVNPAEDGSFVVGSIPLQFRPNQVQASYEDMVSINGAVLDAALRTQNYDKGFQKFVHNFDPAVEMTAVVAIEAGRQGDQGWAVVFKQGPRRCLLLDTTEGLSEEETLWVALVHWSSFQPRLSRPRLGPGELYYPEIASHILEETWNFFGDLSQMPSFPSRSPICQAAMLSFSRGLRQYPCADSWIPHPCAEAPEKLMKIASYAAISRVRPISDGPDQWEMYRKGTYTVGSGSLSSPMAGPELGPTTGSTDTCEGQSFPSQTGGAFSPDG